MSTRRNTRKRTAAAALAALFAISGIAFTSPDTLGEGPNESDRDSKSRAQDDSTGEQPSQAGVAANMYFTDEQGNRRQPTAEEVRQAAEAFQRDLARLAGKHKDKPNVETQPDGTVSATIAVSKLAFLTVQENDDGGLTYGHSSMGDDGKVTFAPVNNLPEK